MQSDISLFYPINTVYWCFWCQINVLWWRSRKITQLNPLHSGTKMLKLSILAICTPIAKIFLMHSYTFLRCKNILKNFWFKKKFFDLKFSGQQFFLKNQNFKIFFYMSRKYKNAWEIFWRLVYRWLKWTVWVNFIKSP